MKQISKIITFAFIFCCVCFTCFVNAAGMLESFENLDAQLMPPAGWQKWQPSGGRGWTNWYAAKSPIPGWASGTISVPPCAGAGTKVAYVTYTEGAAKTNDNWLVSPKLSGITPASSLSFWWNSSFSNHADNLDLMISTNSQISSPEDFNIQALHISLPRGFPADGDFMDWSNNVVNIGTLVPEGQDIFIAFREYYPNNWQDVRANQLDVIETDLWSAPTLTTKSVRVTSPTTIEIDYDIFAGYPAGQVGVCWSSDPNPVMSYDSVNFVQGDKLGIITNFPNDKIYYLRLFAKHENGTYYGRAFKIDPGGSAGEGLLFESFENVPANLMPPSGWAKVQPSGGSGWTNYSSGISPMPDWLSGTISVPPCSGAGTKVAYVTYSDGSSEINDNWLISPQIKNVPPDYNLSFWWNSSFSNYADNIYVYLSTTGNQLSDFTTELLHHNLPKGYPADGNFMDWSNNVIDVSAAVPEGSDIYLAFREYYPNNWNDVKANQLDVISAGNRVRNALNFDGIDDEVVLNLSNNFSAYTIEAWVKPNATGDISIIVGTDDDPTIIYSRLLCMNASGNFEHYLWDGAVRLVTGTTVAQTGKWYHVVGTAENNGNMRLFVNGIEEGSAVAIGTAESVAKILLGSASGYSEDFFNGDIDEVRIWNFAKNKQQIQDQMFIYLRGVEDNLVACYRLDSTWGTNVFDSSLSELNATLPSTSKKPQWTNSDAPLGDYLAAKNYHNRAAWEIIKTNSATRGLTMETSPASISNFVIFGDNNLSGKTDLNLPTTLQNQNFSRLNSVWYFDIHGTTNEQTKLIFNPQNSSADFDSPTTNHYKLLFRENESDTFTVVREKADSMTLSNIVFNNVIVEEGFYSLAGQDFPASPTALSADEIQYHSFRANWLASVSATNYFIDVSLENSFASFVPGYNNKISGNVTNLIVTNLLDNTFYYYRVRSENAAGTSPDSNIIQTKTLENFKPEIATNALIFPEENSVIFASQWTNIFWDVEKITDDIDATNLTISKITLHYADTTNYILEVTNNIENTFGKIEWNVPPGSWDGLTNYIFKFDVVDSSSLTNSRIFWYNKFTIVPEGGIVFSILFLLFSIFVCYRRKLSVA